MSNPNPNPNKKKASNPKEEYEDDDINEEIKCHRCHEILNDKFFKSKEYQHNGKFKTVHFCGPHTICFEEYNSWNSDFE